MLGFSSLRWVGVLMESLCGENWVENQESYLPFCLEAMNKRVFEGKVVFEGEVAVMGGVAFEVC
jgi:hypothetical protein